MDGAIATHGDHLQDRPKIISWTAPAVTGEYLQDRSSIELVNNKSVS